MLLVNEILNGRYRINRQLGHGGMGAVYEAYDSVFETTCAIKEIMIDTAKISNLAQQEMIKRAFEREAKLLAKIKHEVVPHVRDYFMVDTRQFLVMELVEGSDLGELLEKRQQPFPLDDVVRWLEQLLDGLDYLHTQNPPIFHRDLKPQNLKLTPRGRIKLLDFGIAKGGTEVPNSPTINNQTFVAATLNYSPIEQIFRVLDPVFREVLTQRFENQIAHVMQQNADSRSDLYALGATVYHLLTGVLPIDSLKRTIEIWSNKPDPLVNPVILNSRIPPEISALLLRSMEVDYDRRFVSAIEMSQALQQALANVKTRERNAAQPPPVIPTPPTIWGAGATENLQQSQSQMPTQVLESQMQDPEVRRYISQQNVQPSQQNFSPISEETIQGGQLGYIPASGNQTTGAPPPPFSPNSTGGQPQFAGLATNQPVPSVSTGSDYSSFQPQPVVRKKSRKWMVILPLLALVLLILGGGAAGFVVMQNYDLGSWFSSPSPTPAIANTASPTPTATASPVNNSGLGDNTLSPTPTPTDTPTPKPVVEPKPTIETKPTINSPSNPRPNTPRPTPPKGKKKVTVDDIINDS